MLILLAKETENLAAVAPIGATTGRSERKSNVSNSAVA